MRMAPQAPARTSAPLDWLAARASSSMSRFAFSAWSVWSSCADVVGVHLCFRRTARMVPESNSPRSQEQRFRRARFLARRATRWRPLFTSVRLDDVVVSSGLKGCAARGGPGEGRGTGAAPGRGSWAAPWPGHASVVQGSRLASSGVNLIKKSIGLLWIRPQPGAMSPLLT